jgi:hypothetical protein
LLTYSEDLSQSVWDKANGILSTNTVIAPDGTLTGDKFIPTTNGNHYLRRTFTATATAYTYSVYMKEGGNFIVGLYYYNFGTTNQTSKVFNLQTGVISTQIDPDSGGLTSTPSITPVGNGWYRCSIVFTAQAGSSLVDVRFYSNSSQSSYIGDGFSGVYPWGAQLENASFSTSYTPTVASQVTRAIDVASITGANFSTWYNLNEGTLYQEATYGNTSGAATGVLLRGPNDYWQITARNNNQCNGFVNGSFININVGPQLGSTAKVAFAISNGSWAASSNGGAAVAVSSSSPSGVNAIYIGSSNQANSFLLNGTIKKLAFYPIKFQNAQSQGITS